MHFDVDHFKEIFFFSCPLKLRNLASLIRIDLPRGASVVQTPADRVAAANTKNYMTPPTDCIDNSKHVWETPIFQEIPISFEASSYALTNDDPLYR